MLVPSKSAEGRQSVLYTTEQGFVKQKNLVTTGVFMHKSHVLYDVRPGFPHPEQLAATALTGFPVAGYIKVPVVRGLERERGFRRPSEKWMSALLDF
jgi:hypothetical protein